MPRVCFTANLRRHVECPEREVAGTTVAEALEAVFSDNPPLRGYILDEHGSVRRHMVVLVNGRAIRDRAGLSEAVAPQDEIYVLQALSGG